MNTHTNLTAATTAGPLDRRDPSSSLRNVDGALESVGRALVDYRTRIYTAVSC